MKFSDVLRDELTKSFPRRECCRLALLSALFHTAGSLALSKSGLALEFATKSEEVLGYALKGLEEFSLSERDVLLGESNGSRILKFSQNFSTNLLERLQVICYDREGVHVVRGIAPELVARPCCVKQYIKGVYLGCGTVKINGLSGYHLECNFTNETLCAQVAGLLNGEGFSFKYAERRETRALYLKDGEAISDFLAYLGASKSVLELQELLLERRLKNTDNRKNNCYLANVDKSFDASIRQVEDISVIEEALGLEQLEEDLKRTCEARLDHPDATLAELAALLGVSKSGASHRLRKVRALAEQLKRREPDAGREL